MVLAAGLGTRMRPLTDQTPKPLIKVHGKALIDYALNRFSDAGVEKAIVNVHYLPDQLEEHLRGRQHPLVQISDERDLLLETGGGLKKALQHFSGDPIFCTNTDAILIDTPNKDDTHQDACARLAHYWDEDAMDALLLLVPMQNASGYNGAGDFHLEPNGQLRFRDGAPAPYIFTGLQIITPALIEKGPEGPFSTKLLWDRALEAGRLFGLIHQGFWMHVGDPAGLEAAERRLRGTG